MPKQPKLSVITICYNAENYIKPTLDSVASQTFKDIEHVIVDGNSTDNTMNIVDSYSHISNKISEADNGLYDAMNKGIDRANGEYLCFMNGGDLFYDNTTLESVFLNANDEDFIYGDTIVFNLDDKSTRPYHKEKPSEKTISYKSFINGMVICHQSMIVKRSCVEKYDDSRFKLACDIDWSIRTLKNCKSYKDTGIYIAKFLDGGVSQSNKWKAVKERFWISVKHFGWFETIVQQFFIIAKLTRKND